MRGWLCETEYIGLCNVIVDEIYNKCKTYEELRYIVKHII